jgi:hypothetical protein
VAEYTAEDEAVEVDRGVDVGVGAGGGARLDGGTVSAFSQPRVASTHDDDDDDEDDEDGHGFFPEHVGVAGTSAAPAVSNRLSSHVGFGEPDGNSDEDGDGDEDDPELFVPNDFGVSRTISFTAEAPSGEQSDDDFDC